MEYSLLKKYLSGRNKTPTVIGIRHQIGLLGETHWLDDVIKWLDKRIRENDKVMLEITEYPLTKKSTDFLFSRVENYFEELCKYLDHKGCEIIPAEDKDRCYKEDYYHMERVRDNESFIPKMREINPRFFLVGCDHLDYLKEQMPEFSYVNLVNEKRDKKRCYWLNRDLVYLINTKIE